ncbi:IclR family transcriptional regulator domain-containing protein [Amycolatopsis thermoflava]|uniref:IclR family transcriptional regulator domain-containing protein n=1 Tax=Amycolatopsis thermoflava TaxID=84480 RepID=UPI003D72078D
MDRDDFLAELKTIRDRRYSQARGEREPGMASVAAAVPDPAGATAAVQVTGTFARGDRDFAPHLLSRRAGTTPPDSRSSPHRTPTRPASACFRSGAARP